MNPFLEEPFLTAVIDPRLQWFCEPSAWRVINEPPCLELHTEPESDFWQRTHLGFQADNGHFLHCPVQGDFMMETYVEFEGVHQYDQAGLMVRFGPECWIKTSVEFEPDGPNRLGAVVTSHSFSDWSTQDVSKQLRSVGLRITRHAQTFIVEAATEGGSYQQIRLAHLDGEGPLLAGLYACSPKQAGFRPRFRFLRIHCS